MGEVESSIQSRIVRYLRGLDRTYVLNIGGGASTAKGTSDLIICYRGRFIALEVKRPDGSYGLTKPQAIRLKSIGNAGGVGAVVTSVEDVATLLTQLNGGT